MAIVSRYNRKQPAFDPSELDDLIFSPAVGSGVGSHLIGAAEFPAPVSDRHAHDQTTVDTLPMSTVVTLDVTTVDTNPSPRAGLVSAHSVLRNLRLIPELVTQDDSDMSTVVLSYEPTVGSDATVDINNSTTVVESKMATVVIPLTKEGGPSVSRNLPTVATLDLSIVDPQDSFVLATSDMATVVTSRDEQNKSPESTITIDAQASATVATSDLSTVAPSPDQYTVVTSDWPTVAMSTDRENPSPQTSERRIDQPSIIPAPEKPLTVDTSNVSIVLPEVYDPIPAANSNSSVLISSDAPELPLEKPRQYDPELKGREVDFDASQALDNGKSFSKPVHSVLRFDSSPLRPPNGDPLELHLRPHGRQLNFDKPAGSNNKRHLPTVATSDMSTAHTVEISPQKPPRTTVLWITEQGDLVPQARVKRIRLAQDVINSAEESVYDTLWAAKALNSDDRDSTRLVQAGYDYLVKRTRLAKKTIQRIVAKLLDKDFIAIERQANIYQRTATVYRVFSYKTVLDRHLQKGRSHVAKIGPGFAYVRPMDDPRLFMQIASPDGAVSSPIAADLSTVATSNMPTVAPIRPSTAVSTTTDTVDYSYQSTVVRDATTYIDKEILGSRTSSSLPAIRQELAQYGSVDDEVVNRLLKSCQEQAPDCTEDEVVHFLKDKGRLVRARNARIYSPIGFLLTAVPKCFAGEAFRLYREDQFKQREAQASYEARCLAELDEWRKEQQARLADPLVPEEEKRLIRSYLGSQ